MFLFQTFLFRVYTYIYFEGHFMLADASFGVAGDEAVMTFSVPHFGTNRAVSFSYHISVTQGDMLQVRNLYTRTKPDFSRIVELRKIKCFFNC